MLLSMSTVFMLEMMVVECAVIVGGVKGDIGYKGSVNVDLKLKIVSRMCFCWRGGSVNCDSDYDVGNVGSDRMR